VTRLAVVGAGLMGSQIAVQAALHGIEVRLQDISADQLRRSEEHNRAHLARRVEKGRLAAGDVDAAFGRIQQGTDLAAAVAGADLVIEAIVEQLEAKRDLFGRLDELAPESAILASNSSTMVISRLAGATRRPDRCANMHFFSPVLVMELCEVVQGPATSPETAQRCCDIVREMGRVPVLIRKEVEGFIVNRIYLAASQEAHRLYEGGVADLADIDTAVEKGLNWPMGPFRLNDFTGLDVTYGARRHLHEATGDERYRPTQALEERVQRGDLGRKSGRGWYSYEEPAP
jgi:3-hydroxybutyryl-CoA dehydrogenase